MLALLAVIGCIETTASDDGTHRTGPRSVEVEAAPYGATPTSVLEAFGDHLTVEAAFRLTSDHPAFGGLSGLWIAPDGGRLIAVSDIGQRWEATPSHDADGRLIGVGDWTMADLPRRPEDGEGSAWLDSESLTGDDAGGLVVGYEGVHRLRRWPLADLDATPTSVTLPYGLGEPSNSGIEALSSLPGGRFFAIGERVGAWGGEGLMAWEIDGANTPDLIYIQGPGFAPTGADRLDDRIYVVERAFSLLGGFRSRIVAFPAAAVASKARIEPDELAAFRWGQFGENFEGIAARRAPDGRVLLYLIADDNFSFLQNTLLLQLSLPAETS
ncbi:MAG: esterase-like activity of phytase family protein [Alphaproteobacteria bacterium]